MCVFSHSYFSVCERCRDTPSLLTTALFLHSFPSILEPFHFLSAPHVFFSNSLSWVHTFYRFPCFPPADHLSPHVSASFFRFYSLPSVPLHQGCHSEQNSGTKLGPKWANTTKAGASKNLKLKQLFLIKKLSFVLLGIHLLVELMLWQTVVEYQNTQRPVPSQICTQLNIIHY